MADNYVEGRLLCKFLKGTTITKIQKIIPSAKLERTIFGVSIITFEDLPVLDEVALLEESGLVEYAHPDHVYTGIMPVPVYPNDPYFASGYQWALYNYGQNGGVAGADIDASHAWGLLQAGGYTIGDASCKVGIIDSGVMYSHVDLADNCKKADGYDYVNLTQDQVDDWDHGTHVAGIIGAKGNNSTGVSGIAWACRIYSAKALNASGIGTDSSILYSIDHCSMSGCSIVNMSFGGYSYSASLRSAILALVNSVLFICGAGNDGTNNDSHPFYPAALDCANIISVGATDNTDSPWVNSNYGPASVDVFAPGRNIVSTFTDGDYVFLTGTSMATPHVTGIAVLLKSAFPSMTPSQIKAAILGGVDTKSALSGKCVTGGRVNAYKALSGFISDPEVVLGIVKQSPSGEMGMDNKYYCRRNGAWVEVPSAGYTAGAGISIVDNEITNTIIDLNGVIVASALPASILGALDFSGTFNPGYGAPLPASQGNYFVANASGEIEGTSFYQGDCLVYRDDTNWDKIDNQSVVLYWNSILEKPVTFPAILGYTSDTAFRGDYGYFAYQYAINHPSGNAYTLPVASPTVLGGVMIGDNLIITASGMLSAPASQVNSDWNALTGVASILNKPSIPSQYVLVVASPTQLGGIKVGSNLTIDGNGVLSAVASGEYTQINSDWSAAVGVASILNKPPLGTAAAKNIPAAGNASATEVVYGSDTRLTNNRDPNSHTHAESEITGLVTDLGLKANVASPTFTGVPAAPTADPGTNTTQLATTAFVHAAAAAINVASMGEIFLSAAGGWSPITLPDAGFVQSETGTNKVNFRGSNLSASANDQKHCWGHVLPRDYNGGTVNAKFVFYVPSSTDASNHTIILGLQGGVFATASPGDTAYGTAQEITVVVASSIAGLVKITDATPAITLSGTPVAGNWCQWRAYRKGDDTYSGDITLLGVMIQYTRG